MLSLKRLLLVVDGPGVMTHTAPLVTSLLRQGVAVRVALTESARLLVGDYFATMLSGSPLLPFPDIPEKVLDDSDAVLVAPASEKLARQLCEDDWLARWRRVKGPVVIAPGFLPQEDTSEARNGLLRLGNGVVRWLLADGEATDMGSLGMLNVASSARCLETAMTALTKPELAGIRILITCGPTAEDFDPVRFVTNRSTGRMGVALARMAAWRGADVTLVHGPMSWPVPPHDGIHACPVRSAQSMYEAVMARVGEADMAILCAAVADFTPIECSSVKIKKQSRADGVFSLEMKRTPDILDSIGHLADRHPFLVGFAAESDHVQAYAQAKLEAKNCDMLCANDVTKPGSGFAVGTNQVTVFMRDGSVTELPQMSKEDVARRVLDIALRKMRE
ncbi:MAG: bifunctional phosphopantothenoylcysteine decarboxylase/phosphopantothenate--cysteine ligase CoaBC [Victivallales bacterium]|nr:bifunctional phosphopantothenoylcysteine decarboxylase/phosphopantothenate--cysteine ligase CoaBC [Victivallales bacterium]